MIQWAAHRPAVVWSVSLALVAAGAVAFTRLPLATRPVVELPKLTVSVSWPGASAELVESYLTSPIESAIQGVRGVKKVSSESTDGSASLEVDLQEGSDAQFARLGILERLELIRKDFPPGASAPSVTNYVPDDLAEQPLLFYIIYGPYTSGTLARMAEERILPHITAVEGVAGVDHSGGAEQAVAVSYDAQRLRQLGISSDAVAQAIAGARVVQSLGRVENAVNVLPVTLRDQPHAIEDLGQLPVRGLAGQVYPLRELASIRMEEDSRDQFYRVNGEPAVALRIARLPGADAIRTAARVRQAMMMLQPQLLPGVRLELQTDESVELGTQLRDLLLRGSIAFAAVMLVLASALRNARSIALVMGSAAVAIAGTALGLYLLRIPANLLTLAGLGMGIGILVQNGLIVVARLRTMPDTPEGRAEASRRILPAVVGATLTTAVVLIPFLYLQGNARAAFTPFAVAFVLALAWSVGASVIMIPALGAGHGMNTRQWPRLQRAYLRIMVRLLRWRWATLVLAAAAVGVLAWGFVKKVPRSNWGNWFGQRTTLGASLSFPRGSDPASLDQGMRDLESVVQGQPGVEQVTAQGSGGEAYLRVVFTHASEFGPQPYILQEALTQRAILIGGATVSVSGRGPGFYSGGGMGGSTYRIKVLGYSFSGVEQLAYDLKKRLERIPRVQDVDANAAGFYGREKSYLVTLDPDREALARHGITARQFASALGRAVAGQVGGTRIEIGGRELPVNVKAKGARERTLDQLRSSFIANRDGAPVRVSDLAAVDEQEALSRISREDQQYVRIVSYDFRGPPKLAERTHEAFMKTISVPPGYTVGDDEWDWGTDSSTRGLWLVFGIGILLVILSVAMVFDSAWAAAMVFLSLPIALGGSVAAFWIAGAAFGREAAVGVILVVGLAVNQSILLVDGALGRRSAKAARRQDGRTAGGEPVASYRRTAVPPYRRGLGGRDVIAACRDRAGTILLVTFVTLASLLPLAVGTKTDELFGGIALATVGGTIAGTIGALFVVPAMVVGRRRKNSDPSNPQSPAHHSF